MVRPNQKETITSQTRHNQSDLFKSEANVDSSSNSVNYNNRFNSNNCLETPVSTKRPKSSSTSTTTSTSSTKSVKALEIKKKNGFKGKKPQYEELDSSTKPNRNNKNLMSDKYLFNESNLSLSDSDVEQQDDDNESVFVEEQKIQNSVKRKNSTRLSTKTKSSKDLIKKKSSKRSRLATNGNMEISILSEVADVESFNDKLAKETEEEKPITYQFIDNDDTTVDKTLKEFSTTKTNTSVISISEKNNVDSAESTINTSLLPCRPCSVLIQRLNLQSSYIIPSKTDQIDVDEVLKPKSENLTKPRIQKSRRTPTVNSKRKLSVITLSDSSEVETIPNSDVVFAKRDDGRYYPALIIDSMDSSLYTVKYYLPNEDKIMVLKIIKTFLF